MKERPILFSAPMVRAILEGRKTQTRRVVKGQALDWLNDGFTPGFVADYHNRLCPYGQTGDRLWVREAFRFLDSFDGDSPNTVGEMSLNAGYPKPWAPTQYEADGARDNWMNVGSSPGSVTPGKLRPGIHMPRWASRILLEITAVRVERLQDISESDALAEGIESLTGDKTIYHWDFPKPRPKHAVSGYKSAQSAYKELWAEINGRESLDDNPWVWVVEFKHLNGSATATCSKCSTPDMCDEFGCACELAERKKGGAA